MFNGNALHKTEKLNGKSPAWGDFSFFAGIFPQLLIVSFIAPEIHHFSIDAKSEDLRQAAFSRCCRSRRPWRRRRDGTCGARTLPPRWRSGTTADGVLGSGTDSGIEEYYGEFFRSSCDLDRFFLGCVSQLHAGRRASRAC